MTSAFLSFFKAVTNAIAASLVLVVCITHIRRFYSDFFTEERASVSHRRNPPEKTKSYKYVSVATVFVTIFGLWHSMMQFFTIFTSSLVCDNYMYGMVYSYFPLKLNMYIIFGLRLHMVYDGSQFQVSKTLLMGYVAVATLWTIAELSIITNWNVKDSKKYDAVHINNDGYEDLDSCFQPFAEWFTFGFVVGFDFAANFFYYTLFIIPVRRLIRQVSPQPGTVETSVTRIQANKVVAKMLVVGIKVAILSTVIVFSTFIVWIIFTIDGSVALFNVDVAFNVVCLVLMTPYYPDDKYYRRYCASCIFCCDRYGYTTEKYDTLLINNNGKGGDAADMDVEPTQTAGVSGLDNGTASLAKSVDTMSQPRVAAHAGIDGGLNKNPEQELAISMRSASDPVQE